MSGDGTPSFYKANGRSMDTDMPVNDDSDWDTNKSERMRNRHSAAFQKSAQKCVDCKKPPHTQCLHCSKHVYMECAQKHVALAAEQIDVAQHVLNDKMSIIDHLSDAAKERVNADRNRIIKQADTERDQAFAQIDKIVDQQKKHIRNESTQLTELPLDEIPSFVQHMTSEMDHLNENNNQWFRVSTVLPKIQVQQGLDMREQRM